MRPLPVTWLLLIALLAIAAPASAAGEEVVIYRDDYGIPNIFATTEEGAVYGMGYAQAEDRLEELLKQYRRAEGTMAEAFGPDFVRHDYRQRVWQHRAISEANYSKLSPKARSIIEAYQAGVKHFMKTHPAEVPAWAPEVHPWQVVALGRMIIWGWPEGDAGGDLRRVGIEPDPVSPRGSNEWVIAASRTADRAPLALIDPHLSWYGEFRFYEARLYGGDMQLAGMSIVGLPFSSLGHSRYCSVAMTTGGPDAADVYEEEVDSGKPRRYKYDGEWRDMTVRHEIIKVKQGGKIVNKEFDIEYTHHGPIVARRGDKAYAMKLPYFDQFRLVEQSYAMATARNLEEMKQALSMFQLMEQNIMIATVDGDIAYFRNGRVPIRPAGFDWKRPVPGNTSATEWKGFHKLEDLVHNINPWQGYMQNCNVSPEHMIRFCPMLPARYADRPYVYNADNPLHQRAAMALNLLHSNAKVRLEDAFDIAMNTEVHDADRWQARLISAWEPHSRIARVPSSTVQLCDSIVRWNRRADADSTGAIAYWAWKRERADRKSPREWAGRNPLDVVTDAELLAALPTAADKLQKQWGRLDVKYGDVFRCGRDGGDTWPVAGGSMADIATPRAISFQLAADGKTYIGRGGQTSTQVVQLSRPPRSWTLLPLGESDRRDSKHWNDQAQKLFSPGKLKPTYFLDKEELLKHVESTTVLVMARN